MKVLWGIIYILVSAPVAQASLCISPADEPFEQLQSFDFENLETRKIGIFGYLAGTHKDMLQNAQQEIINNPTNRSLILFMEPADYSNKNCQQDGNIVYRRARVQKSKKAMKLATKWITDTVSDNYPECPKSCSFASTTKLQILDDWLYVESAMKCVTKRKSKVNLVHTAILMTPVTTMAKAK